MSSDHKAAPYVITHGDCWKQLSYGQSERVIAQEGVTLVRSVNT
jgi:hypothetical protein